MPGREYSHCSNQIGVFYLGTGNQLSVSPADGLVTGQKDVTVLSSNHIIPPGEEVVGLTCAKERETRQVDLKVAMFCRLLPP